MCADPSPLVVSLRLHGQKQMGFLFMAATSCFAQQHMHTHFILRVTDPFGGGGVLVGMKGEERDRWGNQREIT